MTESNRKGHRGSNEEMRKPWFAWRAQSTSTGLSPAFEGLGDGGCWTFRSWDHFRRARIGWVKAHGGSNGKQQEQVGESRTLLPKVIPVYVRNCRIEDQNALKNANAPVGRAHICHSQPTLPCIGFILCLPLQPRATWASVNRNTLQRVGDWLDGGGGWGSNTPVRRHVMLTCLWTGGLGGPAEHLGDGVLTAIASLRLSSSLHWKIAKPPKWSSSCPLVPFLFFPHACPRTGPDMQMKSPGLPGAARGPHSGSSPNCPGPLASCPLPSPFYSLSSPGYLVLPPWQTTHKSRSCPSLTVPSVPYSCALFTLKILARPWCLFVTPRSLFDPFLLTSTSITILLTTRNPSKKQHNNDQALV